MKHVIIIFGIAIPLLTRKIHENDADKTTRNNLTAALICVNRHNRNWFWRMLHIKRKILGYQTPHERAKTSLLPGATRV